ncbi:MAG TPA: DUF1501 domain-containing protein [Pirellulales bacterium]|jgi:hypothetical protein|nr:DUF1501 domain-containing protein [Pirellulales bacterium]
MNTRPLCKPWEHHLSRRRLLGVAAGTATSLGLGAVARPAWAAELQRRQKQVLFIWIDGGISQLESWDPKPGSPFGGPFRDIATTVPDIHVSELLPKTALQMHHLALVRSLCTKDNAHSSGVARIQRGDPKNRGVVYPYFGSAVAKLLGAGESGLPPYVWIKPGGGGFMYGDAGFLGPKFGALAFGDGKPPENLLRSSSVSEQDDTLRHDFRRRADHRYAQGRRTAAVEANGFVYDVARELSNRAELFDESKFSPGDVDRYGRHELGRHMLVARKMLEAGVTFVKVNSYGWDTHGDNFVGHANLVPKFDQAFAAIVEDLAARGMLEHVLVVAISEFGRTPRINGHVGRDHWPEAWSAVMAGCGIKRGLAVGKTNDEGTWVTTEEYDIGHMFHTWFRALGIDPKQTQYDNNGQPLPIAHDDCHAVDELLA